MASEVGWAGQTIRFDFRESALRLVFRHHNFKTLSSVNRITSQQRSPRTVSMLHLNQIAQGVLPIETEIDRLASETLESRASTFDQLLFMIRQAGADMSDVDAAKVNSGVNRAIDASLLPIREDLPMFKRTYPPQILNDFEAHFRFLISLFRISDRKRRAECGENCQHWWHADLSDPNVLKLLRTPSKRWWQFWR